MSSTDPEKAAAVSNPQAEEEICIVKPTYGRRSRQKNKDEKHTANSNEFDEEPLDDLVDTTAILPLRSKRTERLQKKNLKRIKKPVQSDVKSLLEFPFELTLEILSILRPSDIFNLFRVSRSMGDFIKQNENQICQAMIRLRYPILTKCFPLPMRFDDLDESIHAAILSSKHQRRLHIHKRPYQHISSADPQSTCSCMSCVLAWNNLNLVVDLAHWQNHLSHREPITMITRGGRPQWNTDLVAANATIVDKAIAHPLWYARLLEKHLDTTVRTIVRQSAVYRKGGPPVTDVPSTQRLYHLSADDIAGETDSFAQRSGPPSYEFPFHRDKYYTLGAHLPNRRWDEGKWIYYGDLHDTDIAWTMRTAEREAAHDAAQTVQTAQAAQLTLEPDSTRLEEFHHIR
jgi:hypothetical protein